MRRAALVRIGLGVAGQVDARYLTCEVGGELVDVDPQRGVAEQRESGLGFGGEVVESHVYTLGRSAALGMLAARLRSK